MIDLHMRCRYFFQWIGNNFLPRLALFGCITIQGCQVAPLEDVSSSVNFSNLIGKEYVIIKDVIATGVTSEQNYKGGIDAIYLVNLPGFNGPEVKGRETVKLGTQVKVIAIYMAQPFLTQIHYLAVEGIECSFCGKGPVLIQIFDDQEDSLSDFLRPTEK